MKPEQIKEFSSIISDIGKNPDRLAKGWFSEGGKEGRRAVNFHIKGPNVVVATRKGDFITILRDGIANRNVRDSLNRCVPDRELRD